MSKLPTKGSNILVIGDVHGCFHTLKSMIEQYWKEPDILVQLSDIIDRGNFSGETVQFVQKLQQLHPQRVVVLRGNHEQELIEYVETGSNQNWLRQRGQKTLASFLRVGLSLKETAAWMKNLPLSWENEHLLITHAGVAPDTDCPFDAENINGVVWTRQSLKNLGKVRVVGHTPTKSRQPEYDAISHSWYIDARAILNDLRVLGELIWQRFSGGRDGTLWYYRSLANTFNQLNQNELAQELERVVSEIEQMSQLISVENQMK